MDDAGWIIVSFVGKLNERPELVRRDNEETAGARCTVAVGYEENTQFLVVRIPDPQLAERLVTLRRGDWLQVEGHLRFRWADGTNDKHCYLSVVATEVSICAPRAEWFADAEMRH